MYSSIEKLKRTDSGSNSPVKSTTFDLEDQLLQVSKALQLSTQTLNSIVSDEPLQ